MLRLNLDLYIYLKTPIYFMLGFRTPAGKGISLVELCMCNFSSNFIGGISRQKSKQTPRCTRTFENPVEVNEPLPSGEIKECHWWSFACAPFQAISLVEQTRCTPHLSEPGWTGPLPRLSLPSSSGNTLVTASLCITFELDW